MSEEKWMTWKNWMMIRPDGFDPWGWWCLGKIGMFFIFINKEKIGI